MAGLGARRPPLLSRQTLADAQLQLLRFSGLVLMLGVWELLSTNGTLHPTFVPPPSLVLARTASLVREISEDFLITLFEIGVAFLVSSIVGIAMGIILAFSRPLNALCGPFIWFLYASPLVAFVTFFVVFLGIGPAVPISLGILGSVVILITSTREGVRQIDKSLVTVGRVFGASRGELVLKFVLPAAVPMIVSGLRIATGRILVGVIVGEFFASGGGLGYLIIKYGYALDMKSVYGTVVWIVLVGIALNALFARLERRFAVATLL